MCKSVFRNIIPTVNLDCICSTAQKVLPYAPDYPVGSDFSTHPNDPIYARTSLTEY